MNANVAAYTIYLAITIYVIYWVGRRFHTRGRIFILNLFGGDASAADATNNLLLIAYYLFNIGYACLSIRNWEYISHYERLITSLSSQIGRLILILALTHYLNMGLLYVLSKRQFIFHHKKRLS